MTAIADEIRAMAAQGKCHPLVLSNAASPRGLCNAFASFTQEQTLRWCTLDFGHEEKHRNGAFLWDCPWPRHHARSRPVKVLGDDPDVEP